MATRTLPGVGLTAFWPLGDDTWKDGMDVNLRLISALLSSNVASKTAALPATPALGTIQIVEPLAATNANKIAIWDGEAGSEDWVYLDPILGWSFYIEDEEINAQWNGTGWVEFAGASQGGLGADATAPKDFHVSFGSSPTSSQVVGSFLTARQTTFPANLEGSVGVVGTNPTVAYVLDVKDGATSFGTITVGTDGTFTFATTSGLSRVVAAGSLIQIVAPATVNAAIADLDLTIASTVFLNESSVQRNVVVIVAGQSRAGDFPASSFDGGETYPAGTFQWTQAGVLEAVSTNHLDHANIHVNGMGPAMQFAIDYKAANPNDNLILVPAASDGTAFTAGEWGVGNTLSNNLIARVNALFNANPTFILGGMMWIQGISSDNSASFEADTVAQLDAFEAGFTVANGKMRTVLGGLPPTWVGADASRLALQASIENIAATRERTGYADTVGLTTFDGVHFDQASKRTFGSTIATVWPTVDPAEERTALSSAPASVIKAVLPEHMVFNGSNDLTGFTTDLFGNAANSTVTGLPNRGANGGFEMREGTSSSNYVTTIISEINTAGFSGAHLALCYRKIIANDDWGLLFGSTNNNLSGAGSFIGSCEQGGTNLSTVGLNSAVRNWRYKSATTGNHLSLTDSSASRGTLWNALYGNTSIVRVVTAQDARIQQGGGAVRWGRFDPSATFISADIEVLGWAVCTDAADINDMNDWLLEWCTAA